MLEKPIPESYVKPAPKPEEKPTPKPPSFVTSGPIYKAEPAIPKPEPFKPSEPDASYVGKQNGIKPVDKPVPIPQSSPIKPEPKPEPIKPEPKPVQ